METLVVGTSRRKSGTTAGTGDSGNHRPRHDSGCRRRSKIRSREQFVNDVLREKVEALCPLIEDTP